MEQLLLLKADLSMQENSAPQVVGLESHVYLRALPVALYLLFPSDEGKSGLEAIGSRQMQRGLKLLKQKPVVPAIGDLPVSLMHLLHQLSPFLVAHGVCVCVCVCVCVLMSPPVMHNMAKLLALAAVVTSAADVGSSPASALCSCACWTQRFRYWSCQSRVSLTLPASACQPGNGIPSSFCQESASSINQSINLHFMSLGLIRGVNRQ